MSLTNIIRKVLPTSMIRTVRNSLPRQFNVGAPVTQVFISTDQIHSRYSLTNFPSFFSPKSATTYQYLVTLFDPDGDTVAVKNVNVPSFGTLEIQPEKLFDVSLPEFGMIAADIQPSSKFHFADRHLGVIFPHFYAFYSSPSFESMALVHPQTSMGDQPTSNHWRSNLLINPKNLKYLELFQINPGSKAWETQLFLIDEDQNQLQESRAIMSPKSARKIHWEINPESKYLHVEATGLTGTNAKPLVFNNFKNGNFTACHS